MIPILGEIEPESFRVYRVDPYCFQVNLYCKLCKNVGHFLERNLFPEVTFENFLSRIVKFHTHERIDTNARTNQET